ncbi:MAG: glycosyltransferase [Flavobacteriaceae bacterium]|nr:glycosyltransferase [Flavobacteriaceae bacterium]
MKTIISTGQGRLHLIDSARAIKNSGVEVEVITGWVPSQNLPDGFLNFIGRFVGRNNLAYGLRKRRPAELEPNEIKTCVFSEFFIQFLFILSKFKVLKRDNAAVLGWKLFGWQSKRYLKDAQIFHVRSGAGHGSAIKKAKKENMVILADHSAAHPYEIYSQLSKAYNKKNVPFNPETGLWKMVLEDCKNADYILVNSEYVKKTFVKQGFNSNIISVIPLGIRYDFLGLKKDYKTEAKIKLLYTGSVRKWKGVHLIIEAAKELFSQNILFEIHLIGSISNEIEIPEYLVKNKILIFHGHVPQDELKLHLINADMYVFPSYCEGAAQSLKEAMAAGLPVIATEQSGAPINHDENGLIIKDDSSKALTEAILILADDKNLREKLGHNAAKTISENHTWEKYGKDVAKLYATILAKKGKE